MVKVAFKVICLYDMAHNVKALAMWPEFMASSAGLPMPDKDKLFRLNSAAQ